MMSANNILVILSVVILFLLVRRGCKCRQGIDPYANVNKYEHMAPIGFGTYKNNYPRGECRTGEFWKRKDCEIGNCNLGTTVSDKEFCRIQCAQDPDPLERQECYKVCMGGMC
jgi:hypothetical protein